jgi:RHH-type transcriptional regulator, proline utilization regulon repressor / proline dehydrogenase / delta 1-pyrroline-5-carboxylate dehydrogenase
LSTQKIQKQLQKVHGKALSIDQRAEISVEIASTLHQLARKKRTWCEARKEKALARLMSDPKGRLFLTDMADITFRSSCPKRCIDQILFLLKQYPSLNFFSFFERLAFLLLRNFGKFAPTFFYTLLRKKLTSELSAVLLPQDRKKREQYIKKCRASGIQLNLNHLGEAILSEAEAKRRLEQYIKDLQDPNVDYISIKISTLYSQITPTNIAGSLNVLKERLRELYLANKEGKFINLDMEEYRDLPLTLQLFKEVLEEPEFFKMKAGIVLQAYLPDSFEALKELTKWALKRVEKGGAPIKIRLVKGANLSMEKIEASHRGWAQAPFSEKIESDAQYKKLMDYAFTKDHCKAVHLGIGSHNLFDIAYALVLSEQRGVASSVEFEMLSGIAAPLGRVIAELKGKLILYSPDAKKEDFEHALAYLIRRLEENSGEENFLRYSFQLEPENNAWNKQVNRFTNACQLSQTLQPKPKRPASYPFPEGKFSNIPDIDFIHPENTKHLKAIFNSLDQYPKQKIPLVIGGRVFETNLRKSGIDPSKPTSTLYELSLASIPEVQEALKCAEQDSWNQTTLSERSIFLKKAAYILSEKRFEILQALILDAGKVPLEGDIEISEAIDFLNYYATEGADLLLNSKLLWKERGPTLVAPPWNFSCSIPVGGIAAALMAGNSVLFKPAPETVLVGYLIAQVFWEAGIAQTSLQFLNVDEESVGATLIKHPKLKATILTGASSTARLFKKWNPDLFVKAETGGKNALILSNLCDRDLAVRDFLVSAFGHAGQKCSACSLLILHHELYDSPSFMKQIKEAAESLVTSSAHDPKCKIPPMIKPPEGVLLKGLTTLEPGETWLVKPKPDSHNPHLWSPGIKLGVKPGSFSHTTEFFGPLVSVIRAESIEQAIEIANATPYGLTSGIHTLDPREKILWEKKIIAGNLYVNRTITGAIIKRQPFGGCKDSSFGGYAKAGGPHYIEQFAQCEELSLPNENAPLPPQIMSLFQVLHRFDLKESQQDVFKKSVESYAFWAKKFKEKKEMAHLLGQENLFYLKPLNHLTIRIDEKDHPLDFLRAIAACIICKTPFSISAHTPLPLEKIQVEEKRSFFENKEGDVRLFLKPENNFNIHPNMKLFFTPVKAWGRLELQHYLREVSVSNETHRYGVLFIREK